jgi:hypothetical protein
MGLIEKQKATHLSCLLFFYLSFAFQVPFSFIPVFIGKET